MVLLSRVLVFSLASLSFACLLGTFYCFWSMHWFACWILLPATALLIALAGVTRQKRGDPCSPSTWIIEGAVGGIVAALAYDLYRLPYVLAGTPLFSVFAQFGRLLLGADGSPWLVQGVGWSYHFSNGAALGIMYLALVPSTHGRLLFWGAIAWALLVEVMLLLTPYPSFFGLKFDYWFLFLTASAHLIFGLALGLWCRWRLGRLKPSATTG